MKAIQLPGDVYSNAPTLRANRTAATTVAGGVGFVDLSQADAASTTLLLGLEGIVAITTALIQTCAQRLVVWRDAGIVDDARGYAYEGDGLICDINVDSTTDIAKGDKLKPVTAGDHLVKADDGERYYAIALEARTANSEGTIKGLLFSSGLEDGDTFDVIFGLAANASLADQAFYVANYPVQVVAVRQVHSTAGSDGGAVNLQLTKDVSTDAPGAGTDLLTNNSNAGFNLKGTANTVQTGTLTGTVASLRLAAGDRLSVDFAGTLTAVVGVVVTVTLKRLP